MNELYSIAESRAMTDRLFEHFFDLSPVQRVSSKKEIFDLGKLQLFEGAVEELLKQVPLQYVIGKAYFMDLSFYVNRSVLIPRPETEELVHLIIQDLNFHKKKNLRILDVGTGSGCIAVTLKHYFPFSKVTAIDFSREALSVAKCNAEFNKVEIEFINLDFLKQNRSGLQTGFDLIVSNPPYVTHAEKKLMQPNVLNYEPHSALFVPDDDPLVFYHSILSFAKTSLNKNGKIWFEINEMFGSEMREICYDLSFRDVNIIFDFRGKSRFLHCLK